MGAGLHASTFALVARHWTTTRSGGPMALARTTDIGRRVVESLSATNRVDERRRYWWRF
jgi:hypothetical protein